MKQTLTGRDLTVFPPAVQAEQSHAPQRFVHDPVFQYAETLILPPLFLVVTLNALRRDNLKGRVGRAFHAAATETAQVLVTDKEDVRLRRVLVVQPARDTRTKHSAEFPPAGIEPDHR